MNQFCTRTDKAAPALRDHSPTLEQDAAHLVHERRPLPDQPVADTVQNLRVELRLGLEMGWPIDLTKEGHITWKRDLTTVGAHPNVALKIFGMECIFGVGWTTARVRLWILDAIETFGPNRCMFASHLPICRLACSFEQLYAAYGEIIKSPSGDLMKDYRVF